MANGFLATPIYDALRADFDPRDVPTIVIPTPTKRERQKFNAQVKKWQDQAIAALTPTDA